MADSMQPSFVTVDDQGRYGAHFEGLVTALGLILPVSDDATPSDENRIMWREDGELAGALIAEHYVSDVGGERTAVWQLSPDDDPAVNWPTGFQLNRDTADSVGAIQASVPNAVGPLPPPAAFVLASHPTLDRKTISTFLKRQDNGGVGVDFDQDSITGTGVSFATKRITHALGVTPIICGGWARDRRYFCTATPVDDNEFDLTIQHHLGTNFNTTHDVMWVAIA